MQRTLSDRLTNYIDVYGNVEVENELGEVDYDYRKIKSVWAEIVPQTGNVVKVLDTPDYASIKHKITIRNGAIPNLNNSMHFEYKGQQYDIDYFNPNYKNRNLVEIICTLKIR